MSISISLSCNQAICRVEDENGSATSVACLLAPLPSRQPGWTGMPSSAKLSLVAFGGKFKGRVIQPFSGLPLSALAGAASKGHALAITPLHRAVDDLLLFG
jgi:hypothetical protein